MRIFYNEGVRETSTALSLTEGKEGKSGRKVTGLMLIVLLAFSIADVNAQRTKMSFSIFGGPAYTLFKTVEPLPEGFEIAQRFNPNFGLLFNIEHDSLITLRGAAGYMTKAYFFNHYLTEGRDVKATLNQKIEAFQFAADLVYSIDVGAYRIRPILGGTYSINRNNGGDVQVPNEAMKYLIDPPPIVDVQNDVVTNSFGVRGGLGIRPESFYAFEVELLYGYEFATFPRNTYAITAITPSGVADYNVNWQGKMSYITLMLIIHLGSLV